jgi:hypothetical protein
VAAVAAALVACGGGGARPEATSEAAETGPETAQAAPEVGKMAPPFELPGSDGATYRLGDYRGKKAVVLAWFPKAFTGG